MGHQKGFVNIIVIGAVAILVAVSGYFVFLKETCQMESPPDLFVCGSYFSKFLRSFQKPVSVNPTQIPDVNNVQPSSQPSQQSNKTENNFGLVVSRIITDIGHKISVGELNTVKDLFQKNGIDLGNLQIIDVVTSDNFDKTKTFHIRANQFYQGLPIFFHNIIYHIKNTGEIESVSGSRITDLTISIYPKITMYDAVKNVQSKMGGQKYTAELGIYDLNVGTGLHMDNFVLAWEIHSDNRQLPSEVAWVNASTGELIRYFSGIIN